MKIIVLMSFLVMLSACQKTEETPANTPVAETMTEEGTDKSAVPCAEGDVAKELESDGLEKKSGCTFDGSVPR